MIQCLIVDDEPIARSILEKYVNRTPGLQLVGQLDNALSALEFLSNHSVDLILLDINMPELSGIELLKSLYRSPMVIITSAYAQYGAESYEYNVVDYLLKPIPFARFLKAIQKVSEVHARRSKESEDPEYVFLREDQTTHKIFKKDIRYVQAFGNYVKVFTTSDMLVVRKTLRDFATELSGSLIQIHKSYLVSRSYIQFMDRETITLDQQEALPISKTYRENIPKLLTH